MHQVTADISPSLPGALVPRRRDPLALQAAEEPLHRRIVPAVSPSAHALLHPVAPQSLTEQAAGVLAALIRVEHHLLRSATLLVGHVERPGSQFRIRPVREGPANHAASVQIQDHSQVMPATLRPDIGDVAAPDLVGTLDSELAIEPIRDVGTFHRRGLVRMRARLLADEPKLAHQTPNLETPDRHAILTQHAQNAAAARSATALAEQLVDPATQGHTAHIDAMPPGTMCVVA